MVCPCGLLTLRQEPGKPDPCFPSAPVALSLWLADRGYFPSLMSPAPASIPSAPEEHLCDRIHS